MKLFTSDETAELRYLGSFSDGIKRKWENQIRKIWLMSEDKYKWP
jgi:hypothetical protein